MGSDGVVHHAPNTEPDPELADAVHAVERLGRTVCVEHVPVGPTTAGPTSRPPWADSGSGTGPTPATAPTMPAATDGMTTARTERRPGDAVDLIIAGFRPERSGDHAADLAALYAARVLRVGGILVVLTHCDWTRGELVDPSGAVVTAGQNADLLYLQHIVAVHTPLRDGRFHLADTPPGEHCDGSGTGDAQARARHRALVRGLPEPHRRIHSDVLVFAQPHDRQPPSTLSTDPSVDDGGTR
ncbi:hypothetical protein Q5530_16610 [Saccharothrix sp. BKS2]|uniref:hypothetical protein n=1 Tax=Saccharothrix sp. BKS2 TaxID=3064400 RepID=UPI0039ED33C3